VRTSRGDANYPLIMADENNTDINHALECR
jgi:hypothetical protein